MYDSEWFLKFDFVYFFRDANGYVYHEDSEWNKCLLFARNALIDPCLMFPAEIVVQNFRGDQRLVARWDDLDGHIEEWIASNFQKKLWLKRAG